MKTKPTQARHIVAGMRIFTGNHWIEVDEVLTSGTGLITLVIGEGAEHTATGTLVVGPADTLATEVYEDRRQVQEFIVTVTTYDDGTGGYFTDAESVADQLYHDWHDTGVIHSVVAVELEQA